MSGAPRFTQHSGQPVLLIETADDLARAIVFNEQVGAIGQAHLMRALAAGRITYLPTLPDMSATRFKVFASATAHRPAVVLIGDDDGFDRGPDGWTLAHRAVRWARSVVLHAAGAEVGHYEGAIEAAQIVGRVLVIECGTATLDAWAAVVGAAPHRPSVLVIVPREGVHPIAQPRERMQ
jgi:hypothetical protein